MGSKKGKPQDLQGYEALFRDSPMGILLVTGERIELANPAAGKMFQVEDEGHLAGRPIGDLFVPESCEALNTLALRRGERKPPELPQPLTLTGLGAGDAQRTFQALVALLECEGRPSLQVWLARAEGDAPRKESEAGEFGGEAFRDLIEGSIQGILIQRNRRPLFANHSIARIFGFDSVEEFMALESLTVLAPPDQVEQMGKYARARLKGKPAPSSYRGIGIRKDGSRIWVENMVRTVNWEGEPAIQSTLIDVTDRVSAEQRVKESEERFRAVIDSAPIIVWMVDREERFTFSEGGGLALLGLKAGEVVGASLSEIYSGSLEILDINRQALAGNTVSRVLELGPLVFDVRVAPRRGENGEISGILGVAYEVTARIHAERELRANQKLLRMVFDHLPHHFFVKDKDSRFQMINRTFTDFHGLEETDLLDQTPAQIRKLPRESQSQFLDTDRELFKSGRMVRIPEIEIENAQGEPRVFSITKLPLMDDREEVVGLLGIAEDITERRQAERALMETQKLESLVVMAGGIAHDFNNILVSIVGNAGLAMMEVSAESPVFDILNQIEIAGQRAAELCGQMLAFSGRGRLEKRPTNLNGLIEELIRLLQVSIPKKIIVRFDFDPNLPDVMADATQLRQVVMNLVINASEAIGDGGGEISIRSGVKRLEQGELNTMSMGSGELAPGDFVCIEVEDSGTGMEANRIGKIFDPFFSTKFTGRGLGLAAVQGIVRGHQGAMRVSSTVGEGSLFRVYLPQSDTAEMASPSHARPAAWKGQGTILVIDDEEDVRNVLRRMLTQLGFEVLLAADGKMGINTYRKHQKKIVLVFLDVTMPNMDGKEALKKIMKINANAPVAVVSGYSEFDLESQFAGTGIKMILTKPFSLQKLREMLSGLPGDSFPDSIA